jgi:hypothetical protein
VFRAVVRSLFRLSEYEEEILSIAIVEEGMNLVAVATTCGFFGASLEYRDHPVEAVVDHCLTLKVVMRGGAIAGDTVS